MRNPLHTRGFVSVLINYVNKILEECEKITYYYFVDDFTTCDTHCENHLKMIIIVESKS